jgi:HD-GYP domain-containing protein (c-di-GMP phosphodiesterase class II)
MSTATKLGAQAKSMSDQTVTDFNDLKRYLQTDHRFSHFRYEERDPGIVMLNSKDVPVVILDQSIWSETELFRPFINDAHSGAYCLLCAVSADGLGLLPQSMEQPEVNTLPLPLSTSHLGNLIASYYSTQKLINQIRTEHRAATEDSEAVKYVLQISRELNGIRDIDRLLSLILSKARDITQADAGSIYVVDSPTSNVRDGWIHFKITQNESVYQNLSEFKLPINESSMVGSAIIHRTSINIPDLYQLSEDPAKNPYGAKHDRTWDQRIGYECHSMLTLPMYDIAHNVVGVIQLINRKKNSRAKLQTSKDFAEQVIAFDEETLEYARIVAQQAGIALENAMLTEEKEALFEGFVNASVKAIEQRDPTTSGHSHRVAKLTLSLAQLINKVEIGPLRAISFNDDQMKEIEYASLLHDFGKLGVREQVLVKAKKLYPGELELIQERWEVIRSRIEIDYLREYVNYLTSPGMYPPGFSPSYLDKEKQKKLTEIEDYYEFILKANEPTILEQHGFERLKDIANMSFFDTRGKARQFLLSNELKALSVSRGSLTPEEFSEIKSHVEHTYEFLRKIPWGKKFANVPQIAAKHHEKLDGTGYPTAAFAEEIPVQSRIMTIADIFDALTASDRPYKKAVPAEKALDILEMEVKAQKCDPEIFKIFVSSECYKLVL